MKTLITIFSLVSLIFIAACGEDDHPAEETPVRIAFAPSAIQGEEPYTLTVTVTGEGMEEMTAETTFTGKQARVEFPDIPPGPNRMFTVEVKDKNGIVLYTGETTQSLSPGTPVTISIPTSRILIPVTVEVRAPEIWQVESYMLTVTVTGERMEKIESETSFTGEYASINLDVPSGSNRTFKVRIESNGGSITGEGFATRSLSSTTRITVSIHISVIELNNIPHIFGFSPDGRYLAAIESGDVELWDMTTFQKAQVLSPPQHKSIEDISFSSDGQFLVGTTGFSLHVWDMRTFQEIKTLEYDYREYEFDSISYSPDRQLLAIAGTKWSPGMVAGSRKGESWIWFWDMKDRDIKIGVKIPTYTACFVSFSPDGRYLASVSREIVKIWDIMSFTYNPYSGPLKEVQTLKGHSSDITVMNYSPDGKYLVTGAKYDTVKVWDMTTFQEVQSLFSKIDSIFANSVSFSPDNRYLAVSGVMINVGSPVIKVWEMTNFQEIYADEYQRYNPVSVTFTPDGRFFVTQYGKYTISTKLIDTNLW